MFWCLVPSGSGWQLSPGRSYPSLSTVTGPEAQKYLRTRERFITLITEVVRMALEQEKRVSNEIFALFELAREIKDYRAEQFLQWFVKEQVEEVALMGDLLNVVERSAENLLLAEDYIAREQSSAESDPMLTLSWL